VWLASVAGCTAGAGDIVICTRPIQADENIIKRVTAVEGQQVNVFRPGQLAPVQVKVGQPHSAAAIRGSSSSSSSSSSSAS
jgi:hypothetical protein